MLKNICALIIAVIAAVFVTQHYIRPGLPGTDDGIWAPVRLGSMYRELRQGQFPVRWSGDLNFGYGYPLFHFSYPGVYYLGAIILPAGLGLVGTTKLLFVSGVVSAAIGIWWVTRVLTRSQTMGIAAMLLYVFSPYLLTNLYRRGSIGEIVAAGFIPWIMWCISQSTRTSHNTYFLVSAILTSMLILTHNATALLTLPFLVAFTFWQAWNQGAYAKSFVYHLHLMVLKSLRPLLSLVLSLMITSFFWLPALADVTYTKIADRPLTNIAEWFVSPQKSLLYPFYSTVGPQNLADYRLSIGIALATMLIVLTTYLIFTRQYPHLLWIGCLWAGIWMLFPQSVVIWQNLPVIKSIDFPWRILTPLSVFLPITLATMGNLTWYRYLFLMIAVVMTVIMLPQVQPRDIVVWPDSQYATNNATATSNNEYLIQQIPQVPSSRPVQMFTLSQPIAEVNAVQEKSTYRRYSISTAETITATYSLMYFPGWEVRIDGVKQPIMYPQGLIMFDIPAGTHEIEILFQRTLLRTITEVISLVAFVTVSIFLTKNFLALLSQKR